MLTYENIQSIKYKNVVFIIVIICLMIICLFLSCIINTYDSYSIYGIYYDNNLMVDVPIQYSDALTKGMFIKVDSSKYNYKIQSISELHVENNINYQEYILNSDVALKQNEVVKITFYYNKQKIIKKIYQYIF